MPLGGADHDEDAAGVARAPVIDVVAGADGDEVGDGGGREDAVELAGRSRRSLGSRLVGRHGRAAGRELVRPRIGLAPTAGCARAEVDEAERLGAVEHGLVAALGHGGAVLAIAEEKVEVTGDQQLGEPINRDSLSTGIRSADE
jgi:hypothetical protein